ncbi:hypothetical protein [Streptomyces candidus]|uniref:Uncharacterized protein n=1 Tax=Streptomyces candidus TaxID=67283 RepID=A0A7X0HPG4_9ACTN|nr:hypothetical protein [Streptomyces candidus]MBB6440107.1 hypothetical protein [Streptomyces candidus]
MQNFKGNLEDRNSTSITSASRLHRHPQPKTERPQLSDSTAGQGLTTRIF